MKDPSGKTLNYVSAEEAVQAIQSNSRIYLGGGTGIPLELEKALVARAGELENVEINHVATFAGGEYLLPEYADSFRHRAFFIGPNARQAVNEPEPCGTGVVEQCAHEVGVLDDPSPLSDGGHWILL